MRWVHCRAPGRQDCRAVHEPDRRIAAGVAPENVAHAVAVEVRRSRRPDRQTVDMLPSPALDATDVPFRNQIAVLPLVSRHSRSDLPSPLKSRCPTIRPGGGDISEPSRGQHRPAVHEPYRRVAAGVAPGDVTEAVTVEVVGGGPQVETGTRCRTRCHTGKRRRRSGSSRRNCCWRRAGLRTDCCHWIEGNEIVQRDVRPRAAVGTSL